MLYDQNNTPLTSVAAITGAMSAGLQIHDGSGFVYDNGVNPGSVISFAGGYLFKGCPLNVILGGRLTADQAAALQGPIAAVLQKYGYTSCLTSLPSSPVSPPPKSTSPTPTHPTPPLTSMPGVPVPASSPIPVGTTPITQVASGGMGLLLLLLGVVLVASRE